MYLFERKSQGTNVSLRLALLCVDFTTRSSPFVYELPGIEMPADVYCDIGTLVEGILPITILDGGSGMLKLTALNLLSLYDAAMDESRNSLSIPLTVNATRLPEEIVSCSLF